jgi:hypothetical protein
MKSMNIITYISLLPDNGTDGPKHATDKLQTTTVSPQIKYILLVLLSVPD